ncbi:MULTISPECIES: phage repressor protein CI [unclassified Pantoea]|uniref:phage repressor protein CI n=1 Tax=unclassified Pantoea TaxID=2630326 RepID=UPI001231DA2D|nr:MULTISPECIES: phage repressor protein CI [unclassified Pantoea]KAA5924007.1 phage repressor protein CI [Pantoea sp. VH_8]KAA5930510.1 phage repressor protein CI [Pantoea sp. VH_4]
MIEKKGSSAQVLERLMSSYGVATQKDLAAALDIPANNISGWTQRDRVPGNAIIKCALDTGSDLQWLVTGDVANANSTRLPKVPQGEALYKEISSNGGKPVLRRIMDAYGFTFQKQLCELLGISSATVSTWVRRNYFPGDIVVTCAIDTGVSLEWLATGRNENKKNLGHEREAYALPRKDLVAGILKDTGTWSIDLSFISQKINSPTMVVSNSSSWIVDVGVVSISNGRWLLGIDNKFDIYDVTVMPGKKINVINNGNGFICDIDEVQVTAKVILTIEYD